MKFIDFPEIHFPIQGIEEIQIPKMVRVRQIYENDEIQDIETHLKKELNKYEFEKQVKGKRIALTVGSRGIPQNALIVRTICNQLKEWGALPFIVPAMGSHGGGCVDSGGIWDHRGKYRCSDYGQYGCSPDWNYE